MTGNEVPQIALFAGYAADLFGLLVDPWLVWKNIKPITRHVTKGWHRGVKLGTEAETLKQQINGVWIYPPRADGRRSSPLPDPANLVAR